LEVIAGLLNKLTTPVQSRKTGPIKAGILLNNAKGGLTSHVRDLGEKYPELVVHPLFFVESVVNISWTVKYTWLSAWSSPY
jgi:hypothetical protein